MAQKLSLLFLLLSFTQMSYGQESIETRIYKATIKAELAYDITFAGAYVPCKYTCRSKGDCIKQCQHQKAEAAYEKAYAESFDKYALSCDSRVKDRQSACSTKPLSQIPPSPLWEG